MRTVLCNRLAGTILPPGVVSHCIESNALKKLESWFERFQGSGSHPTRFALPAPPGLFVRPKPSTSNIPILWSRCAPISVGDLHSSFGKIIVKVFGLVVPNISGFPQLPTSHSNVSSPANSVALVSPPNYKGSSAKIVFSTGPNTTLVLGTTVSPPYPYQVEHCLRVHLPAHEQCKHPHYSS